MIFVKFFFFIISFLFLLINAYRYDPTLKYIEEYYINDNQHCSSNNYFVFKGVLYSLCLYKKDEKSQIINNAYLKESNDLGKSWGKAIILPIGKKHNNIRHVVTFITNDKLIFTYLLDKPKETWVSKEIKPRRRRVPPTYMKIFYYELHVLSSIDGKTFSRKSTRILKSFFDDFEITNHVVSSYKKSNKEYLYLCGAYKRIYKNNKGYYYAACAQSLDEGNTWEETTVDLYIPHNYNYTKVSKGKFKIQRNRINIVIYNPQNIRRFDHMFCTDSCYHSKDSCDFSCYQHFMSNEQIIDLVDNGRDYIYVSDKDEGKYHLVSPRNNTFSFPPYMLDSSDKRFQEDILIEIDKSKLMFIYKPNNGVNKQVYVFKYIKPL